MNQKGRDFLSQKVEEVYKREFKALRKPTRPQMEDALKAFIMTSKDIFLTPQEMLMNLRKAIKQKHLQFDQVYRNNRWNDDEEDDDDNVIKLDPWILFKKPKDFAEDIERYNEAWAAYNQRCKELADHKDMLLMKIQIGSDDALAPIVNQADALGNLQLMNSRIMLLGQGEKNGK